MKYSSNAIAAIKERINIADMVGRYVDLRGAGGRLTGMCPFHHETKGSFQVSPEKGLYHCFGCQASGDVIDFYCKMNGLEFKEGIVQLAAEAGVELERAAVDEGASEASRLKKACLAMHGLAQEYFREMLGGSPGRAAVDYLARRGVAPEMREFFGLGYAPDEWEGLKRRLRAKGFSEQDISDSGLASHNESGRVYDRFRGRLTFPIEDLGGRVIAFGARILISGEPKYLNSPESPIYKKGAHLYGLTKARGNITKAKRGLLTEGYLDVITLHQFGYGNACGVLGTALTPEQVKRLCGFCPQVDLIFDGDDAGRKAALRSAAMILAHGAGCRVVIMPQGEDVDSLLQAHGRPALDACFASAPEGLDYCLGMLREKFSPQEMLDWARGFLGTLRDPGLASFFAPKVASGLGFDEAALRPAGSSRAARAAHASAGTTGGATRTARRAPSGARAQRDMEILEFVIRNPEYVPILADMGLGEVFSAQRAVLFWELLASARDEDVMGALDERQKSFYAPRVLLGPLPEDEAEAIFLDVSALCAETRRKRELERVKDAMRQAKAGGDNALLTRLTHELSSLLGRADEQS
jgi:DNA primase